MEFSLAFPMEFILALRALQSAKKIQRDLREKTPEGIYGLAPTSRGKYLIYSGAMYLFVLDQLRPWINKIAKSFYGYYQDKMPKEEELGEHVEAALVGALTWNDSFFRLCLSFAEMTSESKQHPMNYWGSFWRVDVLEKFKEHLHGTIGKPYFGVDKLDDANFGREFEREWERVLRFQDLRGSFQIVPLFTHADMVRYANLPRRKQEIVYEMVDYAALKICPKFFLALDDIEPVRLHKWEKLLLGLTRSLVDQAIKRNETIKNMGRKKETKRGLTQKQEQELRDKIELRILKLAKEEYYPLYRKKEIPLRILELMDKIESTGKKIDALMKRGSVSQKVLSKYLEKDKELMEQFLKEVTSWQKGEGFAFDHTSYLFPWPYVLRLSSNKEIQEIMKRGDCEIRPLYRIVENLRIAYRKAEEEKDWERAQELAGELGRREKQLQTVRIRLLTREKLRRVRPSYFVYQRIRRIYLPPEERKRVSVKRRQQHNEENKIEDLLDAQLAEQALMSGARTPQEFGDWASSEKLSQKRLQIGKSIIEDHSGKRREYVSLGELSVIVGCSRDTLMRMEGRGEIEFESRRASGGKVVRQGGRRMKLFPKQGIDEIRNYFIKDKTIAKIAGVRPDYIPRLKKRLGLDELPRLEQKKKLIEYAKQRRENNRNS